MADSHSSGDVSHTRNSSNLDEPFLIPGGLEFLYQFFLESETQLFARPRNHEHLTHEMAEILSLRNAARGIGLTAPNPAVGAVLLDEQDRFLAMGYHARAGEAHAEIDCLRNFFKKEMDQLTPSECESLREATLFVTLEPCAHRGRTGSCAEALAKLPIKKVYYGLLDVNPLVAGRGLKILERAGIRTERFSSRGRAISQFLNEDFGWTIANRTPFVTLKAATSRDGRMTRGPGESPWITTEKSRQFGNFLRGLSTATLVGKNTILNDDPALDLRTSHFASKKNKVVVLDSGGECLSKPHKLFARHDPENVFIVVDPTVAPSLRAARPEVNLIEALRGDLAPIFRTLYDYGIWSLFVEGGGKTLNSFLSAKWAHQLFLFMSRDGIGVRSDVTFPTPGLLALENIEQISIEDDKLFWGLISPFDPTRLENLSADPDRPVRKL